MDSNKNNCNTLQMQVKTFLGDELYSKYSGIAPLLSLCAYRLKTYRQMGTYAMMYNTEEMSAISCRYRMALYPFVFIKNFFTPAKSGRKIMLSATVTTNTRYDSLVKRLEKETVITGTNTLTDIAPYSPPLNAYFRKLLCSNSSKKIISGYSISTKRLKKDLDKWLEFIATENRDCCKCTKPDTADVLLASLENSFDKAVNRALSALEDSGVECYITINQYNIRDLVLITACRKLGIKTKQLEHHASRFMHSIADGKQIHRLCFVDEICCWNKAEEDFHTNIYSYETPFTDISPTVYPVGNPEIDYDEAMEALEKYPVQNRLTFMVSGLLNVADKKEVEKQLSFRNKIFSELKRLNERTGISILVRYPPGVDTEFRRQEEARLKKMGFSISPSDRNSLMSDICGSKIIVGTISSVLGISALMGKQVFQIADEGEQYFITDHNIHTVTPDSIESITVAESTLSPETTQFMDHLKLIL